MGLTPPFHHQRTKLPIHQSKPPTPKTIWGPEVHPPHTISHVLLAIQLVQPRPLVDVHGGTKNWPRFAG